MICRFMVLLSFRQDSGIGFAAISPEERNVYRHTTFVGSKSDLFESPDDELISQ